MGGVCSGSVLVCTSHVHVLFQGENLCFVVEMVNGCGVCAACGDSECGVLCGLKFLYVGVCCVWLPGCVSVCKDGSNELFVYCGDVFLGVTERCICECSEDIQASLGFVGYVVSVLPECHPPIEGHPKDGGGVGVGNGGVV